MQAKSHSPQTIGTLALILLITGAIDSVRNLPTTALFGSSLFFFFTVSALIFLIPIGLVAAELASTFADEDGGIYTWVHQAFGESWAFISIWLQWINTMVWYPTILSFIAGTLAYFFDPHWADNKLYMISIILVVFWSLTLLGMKGLKTSAFFAGICALVGMILPMGLIIAFALLWIFSQQPLALDLSWPNLIPNFHQTQSWASLTAIMTSFLGMELAAVHVRQIRNPQTTFPRAIFCSVLLILFTMLFGSLAIAMVLPAHDINLVEGVMQTFTFFYQTYHLSWAIPLTIVLLLLGSLGSMINWIISPTKGLLLAANQGFLPSYFYQLNRHGVASRIMLTQAVLVTLFCTALLLFPSINAFYWLFTSLSTELYLLMYVLMFLAAIRLKHTHGHLPRSFKIPGGCWGYYATCMLGLVGCIVTLVVGFMPPEQAVNMADLRLFRVIFGAGLLIMVLPAGWLIKRKIILVP
jgi:amino acid transporter